MRNPIRSESDAFYIAMGSSALIAVALVLGALVDPLVAVALLVGAIVGALVWEVGTKDPQRRRPLREAASELPRTESATDPHVLVVANRTLHHDELRTPSSTSRSRTSWSSPTGQRSPRTRCACEVDLEQLGSTFVFRSLS